MDRKVVVYYDEEECLYYGHPEGMPGLLVYAPTFLDCISDLDDLIQSYEQTIEDTSNGKH